MSVAHPARQALVNGFRERLAFDGIDAHSPLPGIAPFFADDGRLHRARSQHQHHELHLIQRLGNLQPKVAAAFHADDVLSQRKVFGLQLFAELLGKRFAVLARVGDEDTGFLVHGRCPPENKFSGSEVKIV